MRIASWNVNSMKARIEHVLAFLGTDKCDVLLAQELKLTDENFPTDSFTKNGWHVETHGQKTYNGVAIISRYPISDVARGLPLLVEEDAEDDHARYIEARIDTPDLGMIRVGCIYLPNGNPCPGPKFEYKLRWFNRLHAHAASLLESEEKIALCGDYNVMPQAVDCYDPEGWTGDALWHEDSRAAFFSLCNLGYTDAIRAMHPTGEQYSYWDYQKGAWQRNNGIRIDHMLLSPEAASCLVNAGIDKEPRGWERPSDHTPVWCELR